MRSPETTFEKKLKPQASSETQGTCVCSPSQITGAMQGQARASFALLDESQSPSAICGAMRSDAKKQDARIDANISPSAVSSRLKDDSPANSSPAKKYLRGQSAMEFLITYGWAILIMLAVIGVLFYAGVMNPSGLAPNSCEFTAGLSCYSYKIEAFPANASLTLFLAQKTGQNILVTGLSCTETQNSSAKTVLNTTIKDGKYGSFNSTVNCTKTDGTIPQRGDYYRGYLYLNYTEIDTSITHNIVGDIAVKVE